MTKAHLREQVKQSFAATCVVPQSNKSYGKIGEKVDFSRGNNDICHLSYDIYICHLSFWYSDTSVREGTAIWTRSTCSTSMYKQRDNILTSHTEQSAAEQRKSLDPNIMKRFATRQCQETDKQVIWLVLRLSVGLRVESRFLRTMYSQARIELCPHLVTPFRMLFEKLLKG